MKLFTMSFLCSSVIFFPLRSSESRSQTLLSCSLGQFGETKIHTHTARNIQLYTGDDCFCSALFESLIMLLMISRCNPRSNVCLLFLSRPVTFLLMLSCYITVSYEKKRKNISFLPYLFPFLRHYLPPRTA